MTSTEPGRRLLSSRFVVLTTSGLAYFMAIGMVIPVLPQYVEDELGGGGLAVGLSVGAFGLTAALFRPIAGALGDGLGRRFLVVAGGVIAGLSIAANVIAVTVPLVVLFRLVSGIGEAAYFVGVATGIQDMSPSDRRGEAASYFSVTVYGGLAFGPLLGELLFEEVSAEVVWLVAGGMAVLSAALGRSAPGPVGAPRLFRPEKLIHRGALRPAIVLCVGLLGYSAFLAFAALYAEDVGIGREGTVFALFAFIVVGLRIAAARVPDRLGAVGTTSIALSVSAAGLWAMAVWQTPSGVYLGAALLAVGQTFLFPALFAIAVDSAPLRERSQAIATFSLSFDLAIGFGGLIAGAVVAFSDEATAFAVAGVLCLAALAIGLRLLRPAPE